MARFSTYSFEDTSLVISHPNFGSYNAYGSGIGQVTIAMEQDNTAMDVAADMTVVISKMIRKLGTITINVFQSSDFNDYLKRLTSYLEQAPASEYALATVSVVNKTTGDEYFCTGVAPQKRPDNDFQAQAQQRSWVLMAANIENK